MLRIEEGISYIPSCRIPLSADVGVIEGRRKTWLFDTGASEAALQEIRQIDREKSIIISHFHPDHMKNLSEIDSTGLFVGANTFRYTGKGSIVDSDLFFNDGILLHIFPIPSCHAKGSLGLEVNEEIAFIGDALAPTVKAGETVYNAQILQDEIRTLEGLKAIRILQSHQMDTVYEKSQILEVLRELYSCRQPGMPYIRVQQETDWRK